MARAKTGIWGTVELEATPKKTRQGQANTQNMPLHPVTRLERGLEGKENRRKTPKASRKRRFFNK